MKNNPTPQPSRIALTAMPLTESPSRFLGIRQQIIRLTPLRPSACAGYVWRRVFLKGGRRAAGALRERR